MHVCKYIQKYAGTYTSMEVFDSYAQVFDLHVCRLASMSFCMYLIMYIMVVLISKFFRNEKGAP